MIEIELQNHLEHVDMFHISEVRMTVLFIPFSSYITHSAYILYVNVFIFYILYG